VGGHIDTVPAGDHALWGHGGPYSGAVSGGRVWGLGACDMKAGVAAAFMAAIALERAGIALHDRVLAHGVIGEESGEYQDGSLSIVERGHRVDAVVIGEPTSGKAPLAISTASVGWLFLRLQVPGRPTHVALRGHVRRRGAAGVEDGVNAIESGIGLIARLADLERRWETTKRHPLFAPGDFCIHPGVFVARPGGIDNPATFAERATLMFSVLHPPQETSQAIRAEVEAELAAACADDPWLRDHPPEIDWPLDWPPVDVDVDAPLVQKLRRAAAELRDRTGAAIEAPIVAMQGVTDASWFARRGIPAVVCGPGAAIDAHSTVESVSVSEYLDAIRLYALLALDPGPSAG
jgi:acetylornithine deacetylase